MYCTSAKPEIVKAMGFAGAKVPCPYGPADGDAGFAKNIECAPSIPPLAMWPPPSPPPPLATRGRYVRKCREAVGPDYPLMLDCYMALTVPYSIKLARAIEPYVISSARPALDPDPLAPSPPCGGTCHAPIAAWQVRLQVDRGVPASRRLRRLRRSPQSPLANLHLPLGATWRASKLTRGMPPS